MGSSSSAAPRITSAASAKMDTMVDSASSTKPRAGLYTA
jgi:hypothetical protein